jgi:16S rRNA (cytosine967-C5)-methyltransferase
LAQSGSLASLLDDLPPGTDSGLLQELCYGSCRHFHELDFLVAQLLDKPLRNKDQDLRCLLIMGIYQLRHLRIPDHAVVNETVAATRELGKSWASGLVNAVLRNYLKALPELELKLAKATAEVRHSHPYWLIRALRNDWPDLEPAILAANNQRAPMTLRINTGKITRSAYIEQLVAAGKAASPGELTDTAAYLATPCPISELPGFNEGMVSVQDEASQLVAAMLNLQPGQRVLDACAAPGGKTGLMLESEPGLASLLALDINAARLTGIQQNLQRLGLVATVQQGDAGRPDQWWDGTPFDRILLDAPCSATGVIRRHPDIKLLRQAADIEKLHLRQLNLLSRLWACLTPGGQLLYTTCSVLRRENEEVIGAFLNGHPDAKNAAITADWGVECRFGRQLLPQPLGTDGFYYCRLLKQ